MASERERHTLSGSQEFSRSDYGTPASRIDSSELADAASPGRVPRWRQCIPRRYYVVGMAFLGFFNVYATRVNLSVAVLYMGRNQTTVFPNGTTIIDLPSFPNLDSMSAGFVLSSFFYGYILTQLPGGWLACRFGGKFPFGLGVTISGLLCLCTPLTVYGGYWALITVRVIQGLFQGLVFPSVMALLSHWSPLQEKTFLATMATAGTHFGTVVALPLSAALADKFGWPYIFYFFGLLTLAWSLAWWLTVWETPMVDKHITKDELKYIASGVGYIFEQIKPLNDSFESCKNNNDSPQHEASALDDVKVIHKRTIPPPWKSILTSAPVWAIIASHFSENWGFYTMLTQLPTYLTKVLKYPMSETGFLAAVPYLIVGVTTPFAGLLADYLRVQKHVETILVRKSFNCIALILQATFLMAAAHVTSGPAAVTCVALAVGLSGFVWSAFAVNQLDIAPQYAGVLMGLSNTVATIPGIVAPSIVGAIVTHNYLSEWQVVFYIIIAVYIFGALFYVIFARADKQRWAEVSGGPMISLDD